jgi:hypothetical protein
MASKKKEEEKERELKFKRKPTSTIVKKKIIENILFFL